ncbi:hypothetical protein HPB52_025653 [Rhipicephalus sanguineus]|uniref:Uncharacterized protein n=1 Tax=Rhipicephalus sanguineus TaxID=34632 RepID=A0A9D4PA25_RHISA|nr:hypothetical protein HPB52_025653 [Rhipicephalus sanguineus]
MDRATREEAQRQDLREDEDDDGLCHEATSGKELAGRNDVAEGGREKRARGVRGSCNGSARSSGRNVEAGRQRHGRV